MGPAILGRAFEQDVRAGEQCDARAEEEAAVEGGEPESDGAPGESQPGGRREPDVGEVHHVPPIRYPLSRTVSISGGSPSLARNRWIVVLTVAVKGSVSSSHTRSSSSSAETGLPSRREQALQYRQLLAGESKPESVPERDAPEGIEAEVAVGQFGRGHGRAPADRSDAGDKLGELEGLGQVVVGAQSEPLDAVSDRAGGGEHQNPARRPSCEEGSADVVAMGARQVAVQHHDVVVGDRQARTGVAAVEGDVDGHAFAAQPDGHRLGEHLVVFGYQHSHRSTVTAPLYEACASPGTDAGTPARPVAHDDTLEVTAG